MSAPVLPLDVLHIISQECDGVALQAFVLVSRDMYAFGMPGLLRDINIYSPERLSGLFDFILSDLPRWATCVQKFRSVKPPSPDFDEPLTTGAEELQDLEPKLARWIGHASGLQVLEISWTRSLSFYEAMSITRIEKLTLVGVQDFAATYVPESVRSLKLGKTSWGITQQLPRMGPGLTSLILSDSYIPDLSVLSQSIPCLQRLELDLATHIPDEVVSLVWPSLDWVVIRYSDARILDVPKLRVRALHIKNWVRDHQNVSALFGAYPICRALDPVSLSVMLEDNQMQDASNLIEYLPTSLRCLEIIYEMGEDYESSVIYPENFLVSPSSTCPFVVS